MSNTLLGQIINSMIATPLTSTARNKIYWYEIINNSLPTHLTNNPWVVLEIFTSLSDVVRHATTPNNRNWHRHLDPKINHVNPMFTYRLVKRLSHIPVEKTVKILAGCRHYSEKPYWLDLELMFFRPIFSMDRSMLKDFIAANPNPKLNERGKIVGIWTPIIDVALMKSLGGVKQKCVSK